MFERVNALLTKSNIAHFCHCLILRISMFPLGHESESVIPYLPEAGDACDDHWIPTVKTLR